MAKKDGKVIDIVVRFDERDDTVNVAILGGTLSYAEIYKILDRARASIQDQERNALVEQITSELTRPKEVPDV